jgi:hypothetical protein
MSASEPLKTCRKRYGDIKNEVAELPHDEFKGNLVIA